MTWTDNMNGFSTPAGSRSRKCPAILFSANRLSEDNLATLCNTSLCQSAGHVIQSCEGTYRNSFCSSLSLSSSSSTNLLDTHSFNSPFSSSEMTLVDPENSNSKYSMPLSEQKQSNQLKTITLDSLPFEIRQLIAQQCLQADAFHLCLTSKALHSSTISRLYQCIIFDSSHRHFNKEVSYKRLRPKCDISPSYVSTDPLGTSTENSNLFSTSPSSLKSLSSYHSTVSRSSTATDISTATNHALGSFAAEPTSILAKQCEVNYDELFFSFSSVHTVGGIRRCIRTLTRDPSKAALIRRFEVLNNMDIPDLEIRQFLEKTLPDMRNLAILVWDASPFITTDLLRLICKAPKESDITNGTNEGQTTPASRASPSRESNLANSHIETLSLNMRFSRTDAKTFGFDKLSFPNLRKLTIRPFLSSEFLPNIAKLVTNSPDTLRNLQWLHLGRDLDRNGYGGSGAASGLRGGYLSSGDPFFAFASLDPQGVISPAGSGGPVGNNRGVMDAGQSNDRISRGRAFWDLDGNIDDKCIPAFFDTMLRSVSGHPNQDQVLNIPHLPSSLYSYSGTPKLRLEYLGLTGIMVNGHHDFSVLERCIDLGAIVRLCLGGADKFNSSNESVIDSDAREDQDSDGDALVGGFLPNFVRKNRLFRLQALTIDWSENGKDTVPGFLMKLPMGLRSLKVVIRWSAPKAGLIAWPRLCESYSNTIAHRHGTTLENLVLDLGFDDTFGTETVPGRTVRFAGNNTVELGSDDHNTNLPPPAAITEESREPGGRNVAALSSQSVKDLGGCKQLRGLSIAAPSMAIIEEVLSRLPNLRYLRLRNAHSKPYLGQNTSYLLEDWLRYKHIVEGFWNAQEPKPRRGATSDVFYLDEETKIKSLRFVKLEDYIFELQPVISKSPILNEPVSLVASPLIPPLKTSGSSNMFEHLDRFDSNRTRVRSNGYHSGSYDIDETYGVGYYGAADEKHGAYSQHHSNKHYINGSGRRNSQESQLPVSIILREGLTKWFTAQCEGETFVEEE